MADRALSTVVSYAVMLVVVGILVSGLLVGMNGHVADQRERTLRAELSVVGNHLAADLTDLDRLAETMDGGDDTTATLRSSLVDRVAGETYLVRVASTGAPDRYTLTLTTDDPQVTVTVDLRTDHTLETGRYHGGDLMLSTNGTTLEVADD
jgi:type II secretory pathway pseudopilin PulG